MTEEKQKLFQERSERIAKASRLEKPDRVPFAPFTGIYPVLEYGVMPYDVMVDPRCVIPAMKEYLDEVQPDAAMRPPLPSIQYNERLQATHMRWPGPEFGIPKDVSFQLLDTVYLEDDQYDEFLLDPAHFQLTRILPKRYKALAALSKLNFENPTEGGSTASIAAFADPEVKQALLTAMAAGDDAIQFRARHAQVIQSIVEQGTPHYINMGASAPYDMFSDDVRGLMNTVIDMKERPEQLLEALDYMTTVALKQARGLARMLKATKCFIPLHAGVDEFMSDEDYGRFYWPGLKALMLALIEEGVVPLVFCEGNYFSRLDYLADVPKGKVEYLFEKVDMKQAKEKVGKVACIYGNLPNSLLISGTTQEVEDATKKLIDEAADGGGFIMNCSITLDNAKRENVLAWRDATWKYGQY
ncbi:hypothetical protein LJC56_06235 [Christensenellaceae bacterium OttesenSCG-928-K19]|nr:hypothetical protein [Christensenellaceae bacterium OttesenSCG-928-K19]